MAETLKEKWNEFREDFDELKTGFRAATGQRMTRFERDYGSHGPYRLPEHETDKSSGSEYLAD